jgi:hypothetical protein
LRALQAKAKNPDDLQNLDAPFYPELKALVILPGCVESEELFKANARPETLRVELAYSGASGKRRYDTYLLRLDNARRRQLFALALPMFGWIEARFQIESVYIGSKYEDTCISEINLVF